MIIHNLEEKYQGYFLFYISVAVGYAERVSFVYWVAARIRATGSTWLDLRLANGALSF